MKKNRLFVIVPATLIGLSFFVFYFQAVKTQIAEGILYYTKEYKDEENFIYKFYNYNIDSQEKTIFLTLDNRLQYVSPQIVNKHIYTRQRDDAKGENENSDVIVRYTLRGEELDRFSLPLYNRENFAIDTEGQKIAYDWVDKINTNIGEGPWYDGSKWRITIYDYATKEEIILKAEDLTFDDRQMKYLRPLAFDARAFYFIASPHNSFDVGSPMIVYKVDLQTKEKSIVVATGASVQDTEAEFDAQKYEKMVKETFLFNGILPAHGILLLERGIETPREVYSLSLQDGKQEKILDLEVLGNNANLASSFDTFGPLSPSGQEIIFNRGSYNEGFGVYNLASQNLNKDFFTRGDFVAWVSNDTLLYEDFRNDRWDDKYYSLHLLDKNTKEDKTVYTQTTDHVEGADLSKPGDTYYYFLGIRRKEK